MRGARVKVNCLSDDQTNEPSTWIVMVPPSLIGRLPPGTAAAGSLFEVPKAPSCLLESVPNTLPVMTHLPSFCTWVSAVGRRVTACDSDVVSAVHQPDTASWSLSRSDEISRPAVGKVQRTTSSSSDRCVISL